MEAQPNPVDVDALLAEGDWIGGLAARLIRDRHSAEDLAQEARLAALRAGVSADRPLRPWLATTLRNGARMLRRSESSRRARELDRGQSGDESMANSPEALLTRLETQEMVTGFVRDLPPELCDVVLLSFFEGRTPAQIAALRGIPAGTVRWRKSEALRRLRERLDTHFDGDRSAWLAALAPLAQLRLSAGAKAAGSALAPAGLLATWTAMALLPKIVSISAALCVGLFGYFSITDGASVEPSSHVDIAVEPGTSSSVDAGALTATVAAPVEEQREHTEVALAPDLGVARPEEAAASEITRVSVRVIDASGRAVAGATVTPDPSSQLEQANQDAFESLGMLELMKWQAGLVRTTDVSGEASWETDVLQRGGPLTFRAEGPGFSVGELEHELVIGTDASAGDLVLRAAGTVHGRLRARDGSQVGRQMVFLVGAESSLVEEVPDAFELLSHEEVVESTHVGEEGEFRFEGVAEGEFVILNSTLGGFEPARSEAFRVDLGAETGPIEIVLERPALGPPQILVLDAEGDPIPTAFVTLEGSDLTISGPVDEDGVYSLRAGFYERFSGGRLTVIDQALRFEPKVVEPLPVEPQSLTVELDRARTVTRTLELAGEGGMPVEHHRAWLRTEAGATVVAGDGSTMELVLPSAPGDVFSLDVMIEGFEREEWKDLSVEDLPDPWQLTLVPLPGLTGRVLAGGEPVEGAKLELYHAFPGGQVSVRGDAILSRGSAVDSTRTDSEGRFRLDPLVAGDLVVIASARRMGDALLDVPAYDLAKGATDLELTMDSGAKLSGSVLDSAGEPVPGAALVLHHPFHDVLRTRTDSRGRYRFRRVPAGDWYLRTVPEHQTPLITRTETTPKEWTFPSNCTVEAGADVTFDLRLEETPMSMVSGHWDAGEGEGREWTVALRSDRWSSDTYDPFLEDWGQDALLDERGQFAIEVPAGRNYAMSVHSEGVGGRFRRTVSASELPLVVDEHLGLAELSATPAGWTPARDGSGKLLISWRQGPWTYNETLAAGPDGIYGPVPVPAGDVSLTWSAGGADAASTATIVLKPGEVRSLDLE